MLCKKIEFGGPGVTRTHDSLIKSQELFHLSYGTKCLVRNGGFEPPVSWSQARRINQAVLIPDELVSRQRFEL